MSLPINTIVVPQGAEYQAVCRGLKQADAENIRVIPIPIGVKNIKQTLANSCLISSNSQNVLLLGLCGSLSKQYAVGDAVLYQDCWNLERQEVNLDPELTAIIKQRLSVNVVSGLSCDRIIERVTEKLELSKTYPVSLVDMEGYGYIKELQRREMPVAMLRVVSDDLAGNIPNLSRAIDKDGNLKTIPMAIAFFKQPIAALRLIKGSLAGLKTLQRITQELFSI